MKATLLLLLVATLTAGVAAGAWKHSPARRQIEACQRECGGGKFWRLDPMATLIAKCRNGCVKDNSEKTRVRFTFNIFLFKVLWQMTYFIYADINDPKIDLAKIRNRP